MDIFDTAITTLEQHYRKTVNCAAANLGSEIEDFEKNIEAIRVAASVVIAIAYGEFEDPTEDKVISDFGKNGKEYLEAVKAGGGKIIPAELYSLCRTAKPFLESIIKNETESASISVKRAFSVALTYLNLLRHRDDLGLCEHELIKVVISVAITIDCALALSLGENQAANDQIREQQIAMQAISEAAKKRRSARTSKDDPLKKLAYTEAVKGNFSSYRAAALGIFPLVEQAAIEAKRKPPLSRDQAITTLSGWLKELGYTPSTRKRSTPTG